MVMEGIQEDIQCANHPYKNNITPGGICASCLQEKLGKLVSSSSSSSPLSCTSTVFPSDTPSFRSDFGGTSSTTTTTSTLSLQTNFDTLTKSRKPSLYTSHSKGFWSFLYYSSKKVTVNGSIKSKEKKKEEFTLVEENNERKMSRSKSVGCGNRSFSGDFFEKISTGLGDCTLRRVESHREGKHSSVKDRVRCRGIFSGLMITNNVSSSSQENLVNGKSTKPVGHEGKSKSWGWALMSPMRAFSKPSKKREASNKNATPNLTAIPSLLTV